MTKETVPQVLTMAERIAVGQLVKERNEAVARLEALCQNVLADHQLDMDNDKNYNFDLDHGFIVLVE